LSAQDGPDRFGDLGGGELRRRDLVEQRLEEVMVGAFEDEHPDRRVAQRARRAESGEATADDHHQG